MPTALTTDQVATLQADLVAGHTPQVWFTSAAVGVESGRSAKLVSITEPIEGECLRVRPTGSQDVLSFSLAELTLDRPSRNRGNTAAKRQPVSSKSSLEKPAPLFIATPATPVSKSSRSSSSRRSAVPVVVTLSSTAEGEWSVEVRAGAKRVVRPQVVSAAAAAQAAKSLGAPVSAAIEGALAAAREQQLIKVQQLQAELEAARKALAALGE